MNPNQNKCTLDQLLEHAESQSLEDRQTRFRTERLEEFKGSEIYLDNASFLIELVETLTTAVTHQRRVRFIRIRKALSAKQRQNA